PSPTGTSCATGPPRRASSGPTPSSCGGASTSAPSRGSSASPSPAPASTCWRAGMRSTSTCRATCSSRRITRSDKRESVDFAPHVVYALRSAAHRARGASRLRPPPHAGGDRRFRGAWSAARALAGHLALWNPYEYCGLPLLGVAQGGSLYPPVVLVNMLLPPFAALQVFYLLHLAALSVARLRSSLPAGEPRSASLHVT